MEQKFSSFKGYGRTKLANILFTKELCNRLKEINIAVNCLHPGAVSKSIGVDRDSGFGKGLHILGVFAQRLEKVEYPIFCNLMQKDLLFPCED
jgi:NAD(P)-dependent dehydrogenase (short-subunit alcohol dehydrogenase family)